MNRKQPVCRGMDERGELVWGLEDMQFWQIVQLFYRRYPGDFGEQWMWVTLKQKCDLGWDD